uniref:Uncharacterized protein n=1 Tax=Cajanus cajan TaxID=3821 RepID=A0A151UG02_CAJCA
MGFPRPLGSTNPCASVVLMEPFPSSAPGFTMIAAPSYSSRLGSCLERRVSAQLGTVTQLPVHPASPVLLTKNGPLGALDSMEWLNKAATPSYLFKNSPVGSSYPKGNFIGNQLLEDSISLLPLYPSQSNDLHFSDVKNTRQIGSRVQTTPRQAFPQPNGFRPNFCSKTQWFTGFCNSHQVSHFATFFTDARAKISVFESPFISCVETTPQISVSRSTTLH